MGSYRCDHRRSRSLVAVVVVVSVASALGTGRRAEQAATDGTDDADQADDRAADDASSRTRPRPTLPALRRLGEPGVVGSAVDSEESTGSSTFRGNPTRTYYGKGPVPKHPKVLWTFPASSGGLCGKSSDERGKRTGAATGGPASPRSGRRTARPGSRSAPTTTACTSSTPRRASGCCPTSRPATSSRAR